MAYTERLLTQGSFLTRFAHGSRYQRTVELASDLRNAVALDFGCGDGMILRRAYDAGIVRGGFGVDNDPVMRASGEQAFAGVDGFRFIDPAELESVVQPGTCDLAICTETLEHVPEPLRVLDAIVRYCRPGACVVITVPIEVGPSLIGKQLGRYLAGLRRPYGGEPYKLSELFSAAVLWDPRAFESSHVRPDVLFKGHKGFDYREIEVAIAARMRIERTIFSPFPPLAHLLNSTVMWRCRTPDRPPA
jgi:SAM-dependent methyltransferase